MDAKSSASSFEINFRSYSRKIGLVERLHAVLRCPLGDGASNEGHLARVHNAVSDERGADHDLDSRCATRAVGPWDEPLRDGGLEDTGELDANLLLLVRGENRDDAVDRLGGVQRMESREDQVSRLGRQEGGLDGLEVAHLADEDDVWILAQRATQCLRERAGIRPRPRAG